MSLPNCCYSVSCTQFYWGDARRWKKVLLSTLVKKARTLCRSSMHAAAVGRWTLYSEIKHYLRMRYVYVGPSNIVSFKSVKPADYSRRESINVHRRLTYVTPQRCSRVRFLGLLCQPSCLHVVIIIIRPFCSFIILHPDSDRRRSDDSCCCGWKCHMNKMPPEVRPGRPTRLPPRTTHLVCAVLLVVSEWRELPITSLP